MSGRPGLGPVALLAVAVALSTGPAVAQEPLRGQTPFERPRPELSPVGLRLGSFLAFPQLELTQSYDDNIRAEPDDPEGDFISQAEVSLAVRSTWANHALGGRVYARASRFADNASENTEEGGASLFGRLDISRASSLAGTVAYRRETESRADPEESGRAEPSQLDRYLARLSYQHRISRFGLALNTQIQRLDFVRTEDDFRDRDELRFAPRLYYELSPAFRPFVEVAYSRVDYDMLTPGGIDRDSHSVGGFVGTAVDLTGVLEAEVFVGAFRSEFDDGRLDDQTGIGGGASLVWLVTDLTAILVEASRGVEQTTRANASNKIRTLGRVRVEHELRRNILLEGEAQLAQEEFEGIDRVDDTMSLGLEASYALNRHVTLSLGYTYTRRDSDVAAEEFTRNLVFVSSRLRF